jgi:hypothetical protein
MCSIKSIEHMLGIGQNSILLGFFFKSLLIVTKSFVLTVNPTSMVSKADIISQSMTIDKKN